MRGESYSSAKEPAQRHHDYAHNLRQADNLIRKTEGKWPMGMKASVSGERIEKSCCLVFSYQRHPEHFPATASPISLHQSNSAFKLEAQKTYKFYHEFALGRNKAIAHNTCATTEEST